MLIEDKEYSFRTRMYMKAHNLKPGDTLKFYQFSGWVMNMWLKFKKLKEIKETAPVTKKMHAEFDSWLEAEVSKN